MDSVGKRIRELRHILKMTQAEFSDRLGVTRRTVQRWESGEFQVPERMLKLIEKTFNVNPEWLLKGEGNIFRTPKIITAKVDYVALLAHQLVTELLREGVTFPKEEEVKSAIESALRLELEKIKSILKKLLNP